MDKRGRQTAEGPGAPQISVHLGVHNPGTVEHSSDHMDGERATNSLPSSRSLKIPRASGPCGFDSIPRHQH